MNQFGILYRYELKKIVKRRLVQVTFLICLLLVLFMASTELIGKYYVDGQVADTHYHMFLVDREYARTLSGRKIDQQLLEEAVAAYGQIPPDADRYTLTEEYQTYARPYSAVFNIIRSWTQQGLSGVMKWDPDENALYSARSDLLKAAWESMLLSDTEKTYWQEKEAQLEIPMTFYYYDGYSALLNNFAPIGLIVLLFVSITLSGIFPEEHVRKTDQLMLSSARGKDTVYFSKICAGMTVAAVFSLLATMLNGALTLGIYGTDGFGAALQIRYDYSYPLTFGQACILVYGILILTAVFMGVLVMILSETLHNGIATLAVSVGFLIMGSMFGIPVQYRILSQLWSALPTSFLDIERIFTIQPVSLFGRCCTLWQAAPLVYLLCGIAAVAAGKRIFAGYQVWGR
ncbi:MAG: ABC transporter permease [Lachnospiraceae bacterium]|nr:ABC transporter permease [Butyrivibrio sp.]MCM1343951.1 ABC transporter permease [Muribaculaceae bacterium]MCM1409052.1 ABC transporter permease [Lachnospiraceae bacterium]